MLGTEEVVEDTAATRALALLRSEAVVGEGDDRDVAGDGHGWEAVGNDGTTASPLFNGDGEGSGISTSRHANGDAAATGGSGEGFGGARVVSKLGLLEAVLELLLSALEVVHSGNGGAIPEHEGIREGVRGEGCGHALDIALGLALLGRGGENTGGQKKGRNDLGNHCQYLFPFSGSFSVVELYIIFSLWLSVL